MGHRGQVWRGGFLLGLWVASHGCGAGSDCWGVSMALRSG